MFRKEMEDIWKAEWAHTQSAKTYPSLIIESTVYSKLKQILGVDQQNIRTSNFTNYWTFIVGNLFSALTKQK